MLQIIYITSNFNWLKNIAKKKPKLLSTLRDKKKNKLFLCIYKMLTFGIKTQSKIGVEVIKYNGKKWINEKRLETALCHKNLVGNKTQFYSDEFKKRSVKYKIVKIFNPVENLLQNNQQFI